MRAIGLAAAALLLVACGGGDAPPDVPWSDYAPAVRTRIDGLAAAKDCAGLQREFDQADANNQSTMSRTGHNNSDLMAYIDWQEKRAGCHA